MSGEVVLYDYWRSSAAYRVRIALNLKGIAYRAVPVDLSKGEQGGADYTGQNPQGLIPALEIDGNLLTQSLAIIDYLDQTRPEPRLLPADPALRAAHGAAGETRACEYSWEAINAVVADTYVRLVEVRQGPQAATPAAA